MISVLFSERNNTIHTSNHNQGSKPIYHRSSHVCRSKETCSIVQSNTLLSSRASVCPSPPNPNRDISAHPVVYWKLQGHITHHSKSLAVPNTSPIRAHSIWAIRMDQVIAGEASPKVCSLHGRYKEKVRLDDLIWVMWLIRISKFYVFIGQLRVTLPSWWVISNSHS